MATINEMRQVSTQIENETQVGGNTASRVGGLFNDIVDELENIDETTPFISDAENNVDLDISDEDGNVLARFSGGNFRVKNFDSTGVNEKLSTIEVGAEVNDTGVTNNINSDLDVTDENNNILLRISNGHIRTRNFNSEDVIQSSDLDGAVFANTFDKTIAHDSPFSIVEQNYGLCGIFYRWGFVGDSLSSGWLEITSGDAPSRNFYRCSWGQVMCRAIGAVGANFSNGGQTTSSWLSWYPNQTRTTWITNTGSAAVKFSEDKKDVYTICLGVNDASDNVTVGNPSTDVDVNNYNNNNLNTYAGRYGKIISLCKEVSPSCKIFLITPPSTWGTGAETKGYNAVVRTLATMFNKVYLVDLATYFVSNQSIIDNYQYNGIHPSTQGYIYYSYVIANYITYIIKQHPSDFKAQGAVEYLTNNVDNY